MVKKTINPKAAADIMRALSLPGRKTRLRHWTPEFLDFLGDFPDPDE